MAHQERGMKRGNGRSANNTNEENTTEENEVDLEQEWNEEDPDYWEGSTDVNYTGNGNEALSDLDMEEVGNYGADSEVEQFLQNSEETQGY